MFTRDQRDHQKTNVYAGKRLVDTLDTLDTLNISSVIEEDAEKKEKKNARARCVTA